MQKSKLERLRLYSLTEIIEYMEKTDEKDWCVDVVRSWNSNCFFWHLHAMCKDDEEATFNWDMFEDQWATTYMIYPVNDGQNPKYQQATPKQRVLAYLKNLLNWIEKNTYQLMQEYDTPKTT